VLLTDAESDTGTHSTFGSPGKPSFPSLAPPTSQSFLFSTAGLESKPLPKPPRNDNPAFTTPRKPSDLIPDSSGGETPDTPAQNADSEATPDTDTKMGFGSKAKNFLNQAINGSRKGRRDSWFAPPSSPSPGKGEIPKIPYSNKIENRVKKQRAKASEKRMVRHRASRHEDSDSDYIPDASVSPSKSRRSKSDSHPSDDNTTAGAPNSRPTASSKEASPSTIRSIASFIETHPNLPHILSFYAQLLLNLFLVVFLIYIISSFWRTIVADVDKASQKASAEVLREMAICNQQYMDNRCERETRMPALELACNEWDKCRTQDPRSVGRARVSAHTFAEIFNSFIEPISYKAMASHSFPP